MPASISRRITFGLGLLAVFFHAPVGAQEPRVFVGATTKMAAPGEAGQVAATQETLQATEAAVAGELIKALDIEYVDRVSMDALFAELQLSAASAFDATTGAARGLLGRIDFLVVIEAAAPTTVRLRTIDVESGAVKAMGLCEATPGWFSGSTFDFSACLAPFAEQTVAVARQRLDTKKIEAKRAAEEAQARAERRADEERRRAEEEAAAAQARERELAADEQRRIDAEQQAETQRRAEAERRATLQARVDQLRPEYERALNKLSEEIRFWNEMDRMMEGTGQTFRPEIEVARSSATAKIDECAYYFDAVQPDRLRTCIGQLQSIATKLESLH